MKIKVLAILSTLLMVMFLTACSKEEESTGTMAEKAEKTMESAKEATKETYHEAKDAAEDAYDDTSDAVEDAYDDTSDAIEDAYDNTSDAVEDAYDDTADAVKDAYDDTADAASLRARLDPLAATGPFRAGATELLAAVELREGNPTEARLLYSQIADDVTAPQGIRARAAQMLAALPE